jgi:hypothetical protein
MDAGEWVEILSPVAPPGSVASDTLLVQNGKVTVGAFALMEDGMIVFRCCLPMANLSEDLFDLHVGIVAEYADEVERIATAGDDVF